LKRQPPPRWAARRQAPAGKEGEECREHRVGARKCAIHRGLHIRTLARQPAMPMLAPRPHLCPGVARRSGERRSVSRSRSRSLQQRAAME